MLLENNLKKYKEAPEAIKQIVGLVGLTATNNFYIYDFEHFYWRD